MFRSAFRGAVAASLIFAALSAVPAFAQTPGDGLKIGQRACYGLAAPKGRVTTLSLELHREDVNGTGEATMWGALHARMKGDKRTSFVKDGCEKQPDGSLRCSIACDGGAFMISADGQTVTVKVGDDGVRVRSCGSRLKALGTALIKPADIGGSVQLTPRPAATCRTPMARFEKLLKAEEEGND